MPDQRFEVLYPPLQALHEHLREELAKNPYIAPADPAADVQEDDRREDDEADPPPPQDGSS